MTPILALRAARGLAVVIALVPALGGCFGPSTQDAAPTTNASPLRTSGPLAEGFEIEPGSALMGAVFPSYGGGGLRVVLRVDGEMEKVFDGYVRQAEELGYPVDSSVGRADRQWCSDDPDLWNHYQNGADRFTVECGARGFELNQYSMNLRGRAEPDGGGYIEISGGMQSEAPVSIPSVPDGPVASVTDVELAPDLAPMYDDTPICVVEGSALLFDPLPSPCSTGATTRCSR